MKKLFLLFFFFQLGLAAQAQKIDTVRIYFDKWQHKLSPAHRQTLLPVARQAAENTGIKLMVLGFADPVGSQQSNQELSEKRAEAVVNFLTAKGVKNSQIMQKAGKGERPNSDPNAEEKHIAEDRRVDILVRYPVTGPENLLNLKEGETLVLKTLTFLPGRHVLRPEAYPELEKLTLILRQNPNLEIEVQGHICCENRDDGLDFATGQNNLSVSRAKFVYDYLVANGIEEKRLRYRGFGRTKPLVRVEQTEEDRNLNRRVEIKVLKK